jgi:hypothetical protein
LPNTLEKTIHLNPRFDDTEKFMFLLGALKGKARSALEGYEATAEQYPNAIQRLQNDFGLPTKLRQSYYVELDNLPNAADLDGVDSSFVSTDRANINAMKTIISHLESLDSNFSTAQIEGIILRKISRSALEAAFDRLSFQHPKLEFEAKELIPAIEQAIFNREMVQLRRTSAKDSAAPEIFPATTLVGKAKKRSAVVNNADTPKKQ